jgi:hypothetical protein
MGALAAACVAVGVGGGYWLGSATGSETADIFSGLAVGVVAATVAVYVKIKRYL